MTYLTNPFERLVTAACDLNLCWKLYCTTCGNTEIRNGLELIGMNKLPDELDKKCLQNGHLFNNTEGQCFERDIRLAREAVKADLDSLSRLPQLTWLGSLGLTLHRFETPPLIFTAGDDKSFDLDQRRTCWSLISSSWAYQFLNILEDDIEEELLTKLRRCDKGESYLRWQDLTPINVALMKSRVREQLTAQ